MIETKTAPGGRPGAGMMRKPAKCILSALAGGTWVMTFSTASTGTVSPCFLPFCAKI